MMDIISHMNKSKLTQDGGYGWVIVVVCFLTTMVGDGFIFTYGAFYADLVDVFEDSASNIMVGGFLMVAFSCIVGPLVATLANRFGFKTVMIIGSVMSTIAISGSSFIHSLFWFNFTIGFVGGTTLGLVDFSAYTLPPLWFNKRRSIACSISYSGIGFGCMIYPVVIEYLSNLYSIRGCIFILGALNLNLLVLSLLVKEPNSIHVRCVLNDEKKTEIQYKMIKAKVSVHSINGFLTSIFPPKLFQNIPFWMLILSVFFFTTILLAIPQSIKNYIDVIGLTRIQSTTFSIAFGGSSLVAKITVGITLRYIKRYKTVAIISGLILAISTSLVGVVSYYYYLLLYGIILGVTGSNIIITRCVIIAEYIPTKYFTSTYGWFFFIQGTTLIIALYIADIGTVYGLYTLSFIVNGIIAFFGSFLLLLLLLTKKVKEIILFL